MSILDYVLLSSTRDAWPFSWLVPWGEAGATVPDSRGLHYSHPDWSAHEAILELVPVMMEKSCKRERAAITAWTALTAAAADGLAAGAGISG